ncbi:hypothetical protein [Geothrix alkalitolerans]|uniref:hypothetical protein n=1 Tax=Geothrix alkalitolerans TaxID=2922724 RepID=UPI001FAF06EE|nr:hypothetical protein [Geothrix alkalitolerans]
MTRKIQFHLLPILVSLVSLFCISCRNKSQKNSATLTGARDGNKINSISNQTSSTRILRPVELTIVEQVQFDWCGDGKPFDLVAEHTTEQEGGGDFTKVKFFKDSKLVYSFEDKDGLTSIKESVGPKIIERARYNLLKSKYFLAIQAVQNPLGHPLLFLFGYAYASDPGSLHIFELKENGLPNEVNRFNLFYLADFTNQDRSIVGGGSSESFGPCFEEYNPFFVYSWGKDGSKGLQLDERLCKEYNLANYYGWAGLPAGQSLVVVLRPPQGGKPIILPKPEAEALFPKL